MPGKILTVAQISTSSERRIGVHLSRRRLYRWISTGRLHALRVGSSVYVREAALISIVPAWKESAPD